MPGEPGTCAHEHFDVLAVDEQRAVRTAQVALRIRRAVGELARRREVLLRDVDVAARLEDEQLDSPGVRSDDPAMRHAGRHDDVIAGRHRQAAEHTLHRGAARLHVDQLVAHGVAVQRARRRGGDVQQLNVVVAEQRSPRRDRVGRPRRQLGGTEVVGGDRLVRRERWQRRRQRRRCPRWRSASGGDRASSTVRRSPPRRPSPRRRPGRRRGAANGACGGCHRPFGSTSRHDLRGCYSRSGVATIVPVASPKPIRG